jgi:hypothetical protein
MGTLWALLGLSKKNLRWRESPLPTPSPPSLPPTPPPPPRPPPSLPHVVRPPCPPHPSSRPLHRPSPRPLHLITVVLFYCSVLPCFVVVCLQLCCFTALCCHVHVLLCRGCAVLCFTVLCHCTSQTAAAPHFTLHAAAALCLCHVRP